jgi:hypothetical protein
VPGDQRAHRLRQLRGGLALCLAVLLALTPLAQFCPGLALQAGPAVAAASYAPDGDAPSGEESALSLQENRPDAGILPRLLNLKGALVPLAQKAVLPARLATLDPSQPATAGPENPTGTSFHRSSVGTARTPTGPPS